MLPAAPVTYIGNLLAAPPGLSHKSLTKRLRNAFFFSEVQALKALLLPGESRMGFVLHLHSAQADTARTRQQPLVGLALPVWPTTPATRLHDGPMTWLIDQPLGLPSPGAGEPCVNPNKQHGAPCGALLDDVAQHCHSCARAVAQQRHNQIRDIIAAYARSCRHTVFTEQRTSSDLLDGSLQSEGETGRQKRPIHISDVQIMSLSGIHAYLAVRVFQTKVGGNIMDTLDGQEAMKRRTYGQPPPGALDLTEGMRPNGLTLGALLEDHAIMSWTGWQLEGPMHWSRTGAWSSTMPAVWPGKGSTSHSPAAWPGRRGLR